MADDPAPSRRDFIVRAARNTLGALALARATDVLAQGAGGAEDALLYVGTYTNPGQAEGLFLLRMDAATGTLRRVGAVDVGPNPSYLALAPGGRALYAVNEVTELDGKPTGALRAFAVSADGATLSSLGVARHTEGGAPCYVSVDRAGRTVLVANYVGGSVAAFETGERGALTGDVHVVQHAGSGPNAERQASAHAHCVLPDPSGRWALAADLGVDRVLVYALGAGGALRHVDGGDAVLHPGAGPRHLAFHPARPIVYVANELDSTVTAMRFDAAAGRLTPLASVTTLPPGWSGRNQVADIHVAPSGRTLYVSNRGHDSVAVFDVSGDGETLAQVQVASTEGHWPRNFALDATGRWLVVANERSDALVVLARDAGTGRLTPTGMRLDVPRPVCVRFRDEVA